MTIPLTIYLIDGTRDYVELYREMGDEMDLLMELNRGGSLLTDNTWYPVHSILKIRFGWWDYQAFAGGSEPARRKRGGRK